MCIVYLLENKITTTTTTTTVNTLTSPHISDQLGTEYSV